MTEVKVLGGILWVRYICDVCMLMSCCCGWVYDILIWKRGDRFDLIMAR